MGLRVGRFPGLLLGGVPWLLSSRLPVFPCRLLPFLLLLRPSPLWRGPLPRSPVACRVCLSLLAAGALPAVRGVCLLGLLAASRSSSPAARGPSAGLLARRLALRLLLWRCSVLLSPRVRPWFWALLAPSLRLSGSALLVSPSLPPLPCCLRAVGAFFAPVCLLLGFVPVVFRLLSWLRGSPPFPVASRSAVLVCPLGVSARTVLLKGDKL